MFNQNGCDFVWFFVWLCPSDDFAVSDHINIIWHATKYADLVIREKGIISTKWQYCDSHTRNMVWK